MTKKLLQIVPYIATHGKIILAKQMNHVLMDKDAQFDGDAKELQQDGLAYTCIINDEPIASAGMKIVWNGVAEGWVLATAKVWNHPLVIARAIKKSLILSDDYIRSGPKHRSNCPTCEYRKDC